MIERAARVAAPVALALFVAVGVFQSDRSTGGAAGVGLVVVAVAAVIAWRGSTGWTLLVGLSVVAAGVVVVCHQDPSNLGWFGICVIAGWAALGSPPLPAATSGVALTGVFAAEWLGLSSEPGWGAWLVGTAFTTTACVFTRRQRELVEQLRKAQAGLADRARAEERNRIAGEMHDAIGHALTVSLLHVSSARLALDDDPDEARESLAEAERLAAVGLDEARAAVGLLRTADPTTAAPVPSGADVAALVESFRRANTRVDLDVRGDLDALGAARGLAVYRIVQESLTNAARHGDGSPVSVQLNITGHDMTVTVFNGGTPAAAPTEGSGLIGMRERVDSMGGELAVGPWPGGWRVEAVLPT